MTSLLKKFLSELPEGLVSAGKMTSNTFVAVIHVRARFDARFACTRALTFVFIYLLVFVFLLECACRACGLVCVHSCGSVLSWSCALCGLFIHLFASASTELYDSFIEANKKDDPVERMWALKSLVSLTSGIHTTLPSSLTNMLLQELRKITRTIV